ncbi:hypothetical protein [Brevibacillus marinus]|uniref:hypothetical protein n=1 Tax=Brevibacillus marinus TaxID=2496837 RepID=UPI000F832898|nr:hypothetical protein [Brevibacillus marinus]
MKWAGVLGITAVIIVMFWYDWPKMDRKWKRERTVFAVLTMVGGILAILLVFYPEMPGPTQWLATLYKPLAKLLGIS